ncbi:MAG: SusD/RagB family nutrient-binding outer membrane lipoprotein, partial [Bacteroidales bacterium]|nr:SusD/RagB family nutrient-binding outer membrane lipoprotein [Bacteroidales bacterium]
MKKYGIIVVFTAATFAAGGCTEDIMDDINKDNSKALYVSAKSIVSELITSTAFSTTGGDFSLYASIYMEHETGVHGQVFNAETRKGEPASSTTYDNAWVSTYTNIKNAKLVIAKCTEAGGLDEGNEVTLGIAKLLLACNAAILTDLFGDAPFTEAGETNPDGTPRYMQPRIEKQEDIYKDVLKLIDEALVCFNGTDNGVNGSTGANDYIYGGNKEQWKKAAYGLKARYTMRLLGRSLNKNTDLQNIISFVNNSFTDAGEEFKFDHYDGETNVNPLFGFNYSREDFGASRSLLEKFVGLNDPRASRYFTTTAKMITDPSKVFAAPNGNPEQGQGNYDLSLVSYAITAPTQLLSYHELQFLKAEALARLGGNDNINEAKATLKKAVIAGFANLQTAVDAALDWWEIESNADLSADVAETYFNDEVEPRFDARPLQEIAVQKYLAFAGASGEAIEAYNDYRRWKYMGEDFITLANPHNAILFPKRFSYGVSDVTNNPAIREAYGNGQYVYSEPVWWAGG